MIVGARRPSRDPARWRRSARRRGAASGGLNVDPEAPRSPPARTIIVRDRAWRRGRRRAPRPRRRACRRRSATRRRRPRRTRRRDASARDGSISRSPASAMSPPSTTMSGSSNGDKVGDRPCRCSGRVAHDGDRHAVAAPRRVENLRDGDRRQVAARHVEDTRRIAGLEAPDQPAHDAARADLGLEASEPAVVVALHRIQRQPAAAPARPCAPSKSVR